MSDDLARRAPPGAPKHVSTGQAPGAVLHDEVVAQVHGSVVDDGRADLHQQDVVLGQGVKRNFDESGLRKAFRIEVTATQPPLHVAVEVGQVDVQGLPVVVADEAVAVEHAVMKTAPDQRCHVAAGRELVDVADWPVDDQPRNGGRLAADAVGLAGLGRRVGVRVHDAHDLALFFSPGEVGRRQHEVLLGRGGQVGTGDIAQFALAHDHHAAAFAWGLGLRMGANGRQDRFGYRRHEVPIPQPGKPPKFINAGGAKRSAQSDSRLPQTSWAGSAVGLPAASATAPPV